MTIGSRWLGRAALALVIAVASGFVLSVDLETPNAANDAGLQTPLSARGSSLLLGTVTGPSGPVPNAMIRWQGHRDVVVSDENGRFTLPIVAGVERVAASAKGFFIATLTPEEQRDVRIALEPLPHHDDTSYAWVDPTPCAMTPHNCGNCHERIHAEWLGSAHARSATNPRLGDLIEGRDAHGHDEHEWHMRQDHPDGVTVCNACHAPTLEPSHREWEFLSRATGPAAAGVHCDFCHKVQSVDVSRVGLTHGRYGMRLLRPAHGSHLVFGPLDDTAMADTVAAPAYRQSEYCASCHEGTVFGIKAYSTYSEWLQSPAGRAGQQCQDCHMAAATTITNMAPGHGGIERDPSTLSDHSLGGAANPSYRDALVVALETVSGAHALEVILTLDASRVGHAVPTGFVDRHLVLLLEAADEKGRPASILDGPRIPVCAGESVAGHPGMLFAKLLGTAAGHAPAPVWNASEIRSDSRLMPGHPLKVRFLVEPKTTRLHVRLIHRDFWETTRRRKQWADDTTNLLDVECEVRAGTVHLLPQSASSPP